MTDTVLYASTPRTFAETIASYGLPILPKKSVRQHKWQMVRASNPGLWILLHFWFMSVILLEGALKTIFNDDESPDWETSFFDLATFIVYVLVTFIFAIAGAMLFATGMSWALLLTLPCAHILISFTFIYALPEKRVADAGSSWRYVTTEHYLVRDGLPEHIAVRANKLQNVPDVDVFVLEYNNDPFLVAVKQSSMPWWLRQKIIIGAWNTGTELDRM